MADERKLNAPGVNVLILFLLRSNEIIGDCKTKAFDGTVERRFSRIDNWAKDNVVKLKTPLGKVGIRLPLKSREMEYSDED